MINYKQLHYFWSAAKAGGIAKAAQRLHLTPQTLSGQIGLLEETLGVQLFRRVGRRLELTETGRLTLSYADEIFQAGGELEEALRSSPADRPFVLRVGIADVMPKSIAYRLLAPAMQLPESVRIVCRENKLDRLLAELAIHRLDVVLADSPMPTEADVKGYSHRLGECGVGFFATPQIAGQLEGDFPGCLDGAPLLIPGEETAMRGRLMRWLSAQKLQPRIIGEFDDSALMKAFGQGGAGIFPAPLAIAEEICRQYGVQLLGQTDAVAERFYAISVERRLTHPAILAISQSAHRSLFGNAD